MARWQSKATSFLTDSSQRTGRTACSISKDLTRSALRLTSASALVMTPTSKG